MVHAAVNTDHPHALNTLYLKLKIKCMYGEYMRTHKLCKSYKFYIALDFFGLI